MQASAFPFYDFVVYSNEVGHKPMLGVLETLQNDGTKIYHCYSRNRYFKVSEPFVMPDSILDEKEHYYGRVPIIEYPANNARLGAFEIVLSLLDAINAAFSDLADGREQFINALLVIKGADITDEQFSELRSQGGIKVPADGDVKYLVSELNQTQNGETINLMIDTMLEIVGMPKRSGTNGGTSDNGIAVILRDGFADAEARASDTERIFKKSENELLRIALKICNAMRGMTLQLASVEPHFTRQNTDNLLAIKGAQNGSDYLRAYRAENNYLEIAFAEFPNHNNTIEVIGCDNGFIMDCVVFYTSNYYSRHFCALFTKTNNEKVATIFPSTLSEPASSSYTTALQHVAFGDSATIATTTTFTPEAGQQTIMCTFGTNADITDVSYTPKAFYMPMHSAYNQGIGKFLCGGKVYITNGYWCIDTEQTEEDAT